MMIRQALRLLLLPVLLASMGRAQTSAPTFGAPLSAESRPDTLPKYSLDEVVVTGSRFGSLAALAPSPVSVITAEVLREKPGSLLADGLSGVPGLVLNKYGGGGAVHTVGVRGMSSEHSLVMIDGERLNSFQNGNADLGFLSSMGFGRIEVARGGASAVYGSDAVGGVINLISKRPPGRTEASAQTTIGSNGYTAAEISGGAGDEDFSAAGGLRRERGRGNYEFDFSDGHTTSRVHRSGADFDVLTGNARVAADIAESLRGSLLVLYADADRGSPGPVTDPSSQGRARLNDQLGRLQTGLRWTAAPDIVASLGSAWTYSFERYADPRLLISGAPLQSSYMNRSFFLTPSVDYVLSPLATLAASSEFGYGSLESNEASHSRRWQQGYSVAAQIKVRTGAAFMGDIIVSPAIRYDRFSDVPSDLSPKLGVNAGILPDNRLRVRASYAKSFRVPTFNELYWIDGGNPGLKPERSVGGDAGLVGEIPFAGTVSYQATWFSLDTRDRIVWLPQSGAVWSPRNIARVSSKGLETELRWRSTDGSVDIRFSSTWMRAQKTSEDFAGDPTTGKDLLYVPRQTTDLSARYGAGRISFFAEYSWTGFRYTTETNDRFLPHFGVTSAAVRYVLPIGAENVFVKLEGTNLFNVSYQVLALYPMPLREFRATLGAEL